MPSAELAALLAQDLDFHDQDSSYATHNFHAFPAKFPPQLPRKFITALTSPGALVLDPMMGSGTTVVEACLSGRRGMGLDIDPLALMIAGVKLTPLDAGHAAQIGGALLSQVAFLLDKQRQTLEMELQKRWDPSTKRFIDYWFAPETQLELLALILEIERIEDVRLRNFFALVFSSIIITKSGGVSLARDLAHTRPHKAKVVLSPSGDVILQETLTPGQAARIKHLTKILRSAPREFEKRLAANLQGLLTTPPELAPCLCAGDAQRVPLAAGSVDLIVTSPPYAANAIDYMRAHKFSLVWLGRSINSLTQKRKEYIGGEALKGIEFEPLPPRTAQLVAKISRLDKKKGVALHRYYSEMTKSLREMFRVLKPGKAAIVVVGTSTMRGQDTETHTCLAEIGQSIGFTVPGIGVRNLDRDRRMMPTGNKIDRASQIQQRMHEEYVIGFYKPGVSTSWPFGVPFAPNCDRSMPGV